MIQLTEAKLENIHADAIARRIVSVALVDCYAGMARSFAFYGAAAVFITMLQFLSWDRLLSDLGLVFLQVVTAAFLFACLAGVWGICCSGLTVFILKTTKVALHPLWTVSIASGLTGYTLMALPLLFTITTNINFVVAFFLCPLLAMFVTQVGTVYYTGTRLYWRIAFEAYKHGADKEEIEARLAPDASLQFGLIQIGAMLVWFAVLFACLPLLPEIFAVRAMWLLFAWVVLTVPMTWATIRIFEWYRLRYRDVR